MIDKPASAKFTRADFFRNVVGRIVTLAVIAADGAKNERLVDRLLCIKDRINKRGRQ